MGRGRANNGVPPRLDRRRLARCLRSVSLFTEGAMAMALALGGEEAVACTGVLLATLRSAAELLEGPARR